MKQKILLRSFSFFAAILLASFLPSASALTLDQAAGQLQPAAGSFQDFSVQGRGAPKTDEVCKHSGSADYGDSLCEKRLEDGSWIRAEIHTEQQWNERLTQTVLTLKDAQGRLLDKQVIRRKTEYRKGKSGRIAKESIDLLRYPPEGKITRQVLILRYHRSSGHLAKINDAHYVQIGRSGQAELVRSTVLAYDRNGLPLRGETELWQEGKSSGRPLDWQRGPGGFQDLDIPAWKEWENQARSALRAGAFWN